jgi:hypothetical protein
LKLRSSADADELAQTREMLAKRYDNLKSGSVKPISGEEIIAHFREKSAAARHSVPRSWPDTSSTQKTV